MPIRKVIIHAGMPKTGTSSIQDTLFFNNEILKELDYCYATVWGRNHYDSLPKAIKQYSQILEQQIPLNEKMQKLNEWKASSPFFLFVNQVNASTLILSAETLTLKYKDQENLLRFVQFCFPSAEIRVIIYVRNPLSWYISLYQQNLKTNRNFSGQIADNSSVIKNYLHIFGENISLFSFENATKDPRGLVGHFMREIGISDADICRFVEYRTNESICMEAAEFMRYANLKQPPFFFDENKRIPNPQRKPSDMQLLINVRGCKFDLPYEEKLRFVSEIQEEIAYFKTLGFDYSNMEITKTQHTDMYSHATLADFEEVFPKLRFPLKGLLLDFFREKYEETKDDKFKKLFDISGKLAQGYEFAKSLQGDSLLNQLPVWDTVRVLVDYGHGFSSVHEYTFYTELFTRISIKLEKPTKHFRISP